MQTYIEQQIIELEGLNRELDYFEPSFSYNNGKIKAYRDVLKKLDESIDHKSFKVQIIKSERGFGQKVDEELFFETEEKAIYFCSEYNKKNNNSITPDWYMKAVYIG